jgi:predicted DCC family thiol-disulfide oxidoreductase YuxK
MFQKHPEHIIFFDGVCNLCNSSVNFVIRHDKRNRFHFASLQWDVARELLSENYPEGDDFQTILYYDKGKIFEKSTAVLRIARQLGFQWKFAYSFIIIPKFIRDAVYMYISRNRYKWFGKRDKCMIPSPELKNKFLNSSL